jgi:hypothetical protein
LEEKKAEKEIGHSAEQISFVEKQDLCFDERHVTSSRSGELLNPNILFVRRIERSEQSQYARGSRHLLKLRLGLLARL